MNDDLDTDDKAQDNDLDQKDDQNQDDDKDGDVTDGTKQYVKSWGGRMQKDINELKDLVRESLKPASSGDDDYVAPQEGGDGPITKFNEQLSQGLLGDNPLAAIQKAMTVIDSAKTNQSNAQKVQTDKAITAMSDQPYYKDIYPDMQKIAHEVAGQMDSKMVADYAYTKAKANFMESQSNSGDPDLGLLPGGKRVVIPKAGKLPEQFKQAFERDKAKGLFKDEADYIAHLSPEIRDKYGI